MPIGVDDTRRGIVLRAEVLYLKDRTTEALEAIREAQELIERSGERWWCAIGARGLILF
jgi:hypothetical protein